MKVTWLHQASLYFENDNIKILVDPYFSNSVGERSPEKNRRLPVPDGALSLTPDVILITHDHLDHLDPETLGTLLNRAEKPITVIAPRGAYEKAVGFGGEHNYVLLAPSSVWSQNGVTFYSVRAAHSDKYAVGYIIDDGEKTFYVSGDTLYNFDVIDDVLDLAPDGVTYAFLPINGKGNNMNAQDAADFAYEISADRAIPVHYGLFDDVDPETFDFEDRIILEPLVATEL